MQKQPFLVGGESKKFDDWEGGGGVKNFRTGGGYRFGGVTFAGEGGGRVSTPLHAMRQLLKNIHYRLWHWKN